jgi:hypothetical protein
LGRFLVDAAATGGAAIYNLQLVPTFAPQTPFLCIERLLHLRTTSLLVTVSSVLRLRHLDEEPGTDFLKRLVHIADCQGHEGLVPNRRSFAGAFAAEAKTRMAGLPVVKKN